MDTNRSYTVWFIVLFAGLVLLFLLNVSLGSVKIPLEDVLSALSGNGASKSSWEYIITDYRLPKALTAILAGGGLAVSGLLMQTLFRNPLAGPFVLGLSSGASLGVALLILGAGAFGGFLGSLLLSQWSLVIASALGSFLVLLAVLAVTLRVKDSMAILIIGLMFGSVTAAVVAVLSYFSTAEKLQQYIFWSFGSLGNQSWSGILILALCCILGIIIAFASCKSLNALLLGENYAKSMGLRIKRTTLLIILATSILAGGITAFAGPIAFVGLAVPHLTRQLFTTSNHFVLLPAVLLSGAILMLICDTVAQLPMSEETLPINAITSLIGAPVVIWLLVRKRKLLF
ncbi:MAG: iron ABC transporter permease [Bacteroidia bacterium]|nr:iron ABC transporter permease [Bacteroidia bacterium]NNF31195.1 iron ABC transporter permease [Flavobacteriaceae bacterium]MBT8274813.1 iron ABC transporter permease [Bacteroidia bacterium]NNJ80626.1 iron ABC transporter permease [Flavobacteriaceae bacterium]NNK54625.1 iron ABC transporter permease [Flavobacteriaceae bacterium]